MSNEVQSDAGRVSVAIESGGVGRITFQHPKANSLPAVILKDLAERIDEFGRDDSIRVIVLQSAGDKAFCAGASFEEFQHIQTEEQGFQFFSGFARLILSMRSAPKFVLTRVQGKAVGGGVGIVAASDYAIASREASAKLSEFDLGIGPFVVGPAVERRIGFAAFSEMSIDTAWRDAAWLAARGFYSQLANDTSSLDGAVAEMAGRLASASPVATRELKAILWGGTEQWTELLYNRARISGRLLAAERGRKASV